MGEMDLHVRLPAQCRQRLDGWRRERRLTLGAAVAELVRRGLEQPPPAPALGEARPGLLQEAALACLVAIEETRLYLEAALPPGEVDAADLAPRAAQAAEERLTAARMALGDWQP